MGMSVCVRKMTVFNEKPELNNTLYFYTLLLETGQVWVQIHMLLVAMYRRWSICYSWQCTSDDPYATHGNVQEMIHTLLMAMCGWWSMCYPWQCMGWWSMCYPWQYIGKDPCDYHDNLACSNVCCLDSLLKCKESCLSSCTSTWYLSIVPVPQHLLQSSQLQDITPLLLYKKTIIVCNPTGN